MIYVYWKSAQARLNGPATQAALVVAEALAATGFTVSVGACLTAERSNGFPGLPFSFVWTAQVDPAPAGQAEIAIEYGMRATPGTWIALGLAVALIFPLVVVSEMASVLMMAPMIPIVWLGGAVIAMKLRQAQLERRLWQAIGERLSVTAFATSVRAVS